MRRVVFSLLPVIVLTLAAAGTLPASEPTEKPSAANPVQPVEITADELVSYGDRNYAEFSGNVTAVQGDFSIRSDTLRIYYQASAVGESKKSTQPDAIEKIEAIGSVLIQAQDRRAETSRAEYRLKDDMVVLSGENSIVSDGKNTLTGSKITWFRKSGQITVEGSDRQRVKALFYSQENLALPTQDRSAPSDSPSKK